MCVKHLAQCLAHDKCSVFASVAVFDDGRGGDVGRSAGSDLR